MNQKITYKHINQEAPLRSDRIRDADRVDAFTVDLSSHVYLLAHRTASLIKIGKANSIISRATTLGLADFDLSNSIGLKVATEREAFDLERLLHTALKSYRATVDQASESVEHSSGMTEWFNANCMGRAQELLNHIQDLVPFKLVELSIPTKQSKRNRTILTEEERRLRQRQALENAQMWNVQSAIQFEQSFNNLRNLVNFIGVTTPNKDMFCVHFAFAGDDLEEVSFETLDMFASANFRTLGGSTSLIGGLFSKFENKSNRWFSKINVYRPYVDPVEDHGAEAIESLYLPFLSFMRSLQLMDN